MSEFIINFKVNHADDINREKQWVQHFPDMKIKHINEPEFHFIAATSETLPHWENVHIESESLWVTLAGRAFFDTDEKFKILNSNTGITVSQLICKMYLEEGLISLESLNGSFVAFIYDSLSKKLHVVRDQTGMFPCYIAFDSQQRPVIGSSADLVSKISGVDGYLDNTSISEFILTGSISAPYTYYEKVRALDPGSVTTINVGDNISIEASRKYFIIDYKEENSVSDWELAEELTTALRKAVKRRSGKLMGKTAVTLSAGLDSRTILCSADREKIIAISFYDNENKELRIARQIAKVAGVRLVEIQRTPNHYIETAAQAVKIYGGMGAISNNHFLGFRETFNELEVTNLLAGFYYDYLFKGLAVNINRSRIFGRNTLSEFKYCWYRPICSDLKKGKDQAVYKRWDQRYAIKNGMTKLSPLELERARLFPLCYEPDHAETIVPMKVMQISLPSIDCDVIRVYGKIPIDLKLSTIFFEKCAILLCDKKIAKITNINTGVSILANTVNRRIHSYLKMLRNFCENRLGMRASGAWPVWRTLIRQSTLLREIWENRHYEFSEFLIDYTGKDPYKCTYENYADSDSELFLRYLTLKLWKENCLSK